MKSILDRSFRYTPSGQTDLRKTFARVRRELRLTEQQAIEAAAEAKVKVAQLRRDPRDLVKQLSSGKL